MAVDLASGMVSCVIEGDTLVLDTGEKNRLAGINSLELAKENGFAKPLANEAKSAHEMLLIDG